MQIIQETLNRYNNADDALREAKRLVKQLEQLTGDILNANTEPIILRGPEGADPTVEYRVIIPTTLTHQGVGTVIRVGPIEYMRVWDVFEQWCDSLGKRVSSQDVFRNMLEYSDDCQIINIGR